jgi:DNA processing protein
MAADARLRAWVALATAHGRDARRLHALLSAFGDPDAVVAATASSLARHVPSDVAEAVARAVRDSRERADAALAWAAEAGNHLLAWDDSDYPGTLFDTGDAPPLLWCKGRRELLQKTGIAIVGSRNASPAGLRTAEEFAEALAAAGLTVVSGLALGIDAAAHRGALAAGIGAGSSVAVIGTDIDRIYPARNRDLAHRLASEGAIVSEFPLGTPPLARHFPQRNRLISGLARAVLVVEARLDSGSLITARYAGEQGRDVFAIPGSIHSPLAKGCHKLIKEGAKLVESAHDVLVEVMPGAAPARGTPAAEDAAGGKSEPPRDSAGGMLLRELGFEAGTPDELVARLAWPVERVMAQLLELEMAGRVAQMAGGRFQRQR